MNGSRPAVSVVLPTYNRAGLLPDVLENLRRQTFEDFEVLVVDDGSDDGTEQMFRGGDHEWVRYIRHETNRGASAARNTGIRKARGRYIAFQDSDDRWKPNKLEKQAAVMEKAPNKVGLVYTGTEREDPEGNVVPVLVPRHRGNVHEQQLYRDGLPGTPTWMVRRECFEVIGTFNQAYRVREDYEFNLRLTRHYDVDYVRGPMVTIGSSAENRLTDAPEDYVEGHRKIIEEQVKPDLRSRGMLFRHRALASQYFSLGRFCQRRGLYGTATKYFLRTLRYHPFHLKSWGSLGFTLLNRDLPAVYYRYRQGKHRPNG